MLKKYKDDYFSDNVQFILTDNQGIVLESDQSFLKIEIGTPMEEVHPFFGSISAVQELSENTTFFNCVQLGKNAMERIVDIEMHKKKEGVLVMVHDLTDHYVSYQAIAQSRNESIINSELVVLKNLELQEREKFKNQFIRNFSHELRNPLTSIISITNILRSTDLSDEQKKMIDFLKESNSNLKIMLEDILSIGMIASGKLHLDHKIFSLSDLLELLRFTYRARAKEQNLTFNLDFGTKVPEHVEGDRLRIYQILTNLLDNAFKHTKEGSVTLSVELNQKWANRASMRFSVSDTGAGIPKESIQAIFESFHQIETGNGDGSGLGLPIVKGLLELMGSKVQLISKLGDGSKFYFDIVLKEPIHTLATTKRNKETVANYQKKKSLSGAAKYKILLVEDDEKVQMLLFKTLLGAKCFNIDFESDGAKVMQTILQGNYDAIIMDVSLPNVNGDHITRLIREFPLKQIKKIPILGLTANAYADDIALYKKAGMNILMTKPFEEEELLNSVFKLVSN